MRWEDYFDEGKVKRTNVDLSRIKSLVTMSDNILKSLNEININPINSSMLISNYYEALRLIVEALTIQEGFLVFSHEALTSFLNEILKNEILSNKFDYYREIRNKVNYYGEHIDINLTELARTEIPSLINSLKRYIK